VRQNRLPKYLEPNEIFMGKYKIIDIISYNSIYLNMLMQKPSVFENLNKEGMSPKHVIGGTLMSF